jgi:hypothetical protein
VATPPETDTERMGETSMTIPWLEERPAKQCPPLLVAVRKPDRPASATVSATSLAVLHSTTACGRRSWNRAMNGLRTAS